MEAAFDKRDQNPQLLKGGPARIRECQSVNVASGQTCACQTTTHICHPIALQQFQPKYKVPDSYRNPGTGAMSTHTHPKCNPIIAGRLNSPAFVPSNQHIRFIKIFEGYHSMSGSCWGFEAWASTLWLVYVVGTLALPTLQMATGGPPAHFRSHPAFIPRDLAVLPDAC